MTVKELRTLVDNLDEYIRIPGGIERLRDTILHLAVSGHLVPQSFADGSGKDFVDHIHAEKLVLLNGNQARKSIDIRPITDSEKPFEIPTSWTWERIQNVSLVITDGEHISPKKTDVGIPLVTAKDVRGDGVDLSKTSYVSRIDAEKFWKRCRPEDNDLLICSRGTIGRSTISNAGQEYCLMGSVILVKFTSKQAISTFTKYYLDTIAGQKQIGALTMGTAVNALYLKDIKDAVIPIPPLHEQIRIVETVRQCMSILGRLHQEYKTEEKTRRMLTSSSLKSMRRGNDLALNHFSEIVKNQADVHEIEKAVLRLAVSGQLVPQYSSEGTGKELHAQIKSERAKLIYQGMLKKQKVLPPIKSEEVPFAVPNSWEWVRLGDITNYGTSLKAKPTDIPPDAWLLDLEDIEKDRSIILKRLPASARRSTSNKNVFEKGDVLYGKLRPYLNKVIVANEPGYSTSELLPIRVPANLSDPYYLLFVLKSPYFSEYVNAITYGVKMPRLGTDDGRRALVPLPPLEEQVRIVRKVDYICRLTKDLRAII